METETAFTLVGMFIAGLLGIIRTYYPKLPEPVIPIIVFGFAAAFVLVGINSGEIEGGLTLRTLVGMFNQGAVALGIARGTTYLAGKNEEGVSRIAAAANTVLPGTPPPPPR